jgi:hypothetical protein
MRVACQAPAVVTGRFMPELKAKGQEKGEDTLDKGLRVAKQLKVGGFILKLNDHQLKAGGRLDDRTRAESLPIRYIFS